MIFKFKNFITFNTFKTFYTELYNTLIFSWRDTLQKYFFEKISLFKLDKQIIIPLSNLLFFKITNLNENTLDFIQKVDPKVLIYIPVKIINLYKNTFKLIYFLIGEVPLYTHNKSLIINGLKKIYLSKIILDNTGLIYNTFIKKNKNIFYARLSLTPKFKINIILEDNTFYILLDSFKLNLIHFLYCLGMSGSDILNLSKYNNSFILKNALINSTYNSINLKLTPTLSKLILYLNSLYVLDHSYIKNIINCSYKLKQTLNTFTWNRLIAEDFIYIIDTLLDIKFKKKSIKTLDNLNSKSIHNISDFYSEQFTKFISLNSTRLKQDLIKFVQTNKYLFNTVSCVSFKSSIYFKLKEYITLNPLIQYTEQINTLSEIAHKNRVTNYTYKTQQTLDGRDITLNQLGNLCLIDTTEGINCGLVISFTKYIKLNSNKSILFPFSYIKDFKSKKFVQFINSFVRETYFVVFNNYYLRKNKILNYCTLTLNKSEFKIKNIELNNTIYIKPQYLLSFTQNLIPFLFYNDPTRCLMGAKMQAQSVPVLKQAKSYILTGYEKDCILNTETVLRAVKEGIVVFVSSYKIVIRDLFNRTIIYYLTKYKKSNQNTIINQTPIVWPGEKVFSGQILTNTQDIIDSESVLGNNLLISYGNFNGYNFEDALVINKRVVYKQLFTSLHFNVYETTFNLLNEDFLEISSLNMLKSNAICTKNLDNLGIVKEGSKVLNNDVLISKLIIKPINISFISVLPLINTFFGEEIREFKDVSIRVPFGESGRVIKTELFSTPDLISSKFYLKCRLFICKQRILSVGDKLCGRYGNKGIIAYIASNNELPYTNRSFIPDIITDALGIPSRLNIGQLFESLFGLSCFIKNIRMCITNTFNIPKIYYKTLIYNTLSNLSKSKSLKGIYNSYIPGKILLRDGRTGYKLSEPSFLGVSKYSKLIHMVKDKVHYRIIGPYTDLLQQPVKGRSNLGGQRFGEMEIWALEAYGASYNLREVLNYKSDDINARESVQEMILNNKPLVDISVPETFRLLIRELNGISLNIETFSNIDQLEGYNLPVNINF